MAFYEQFAEQNSTDPAVRREVGRAYRRAAEIHLRLGQHAQVKEAARRAIAIAGQLAAEFPEQHSLLLRL